MADRLDVLSMSSPTGQSGPSWDTWLMFFFAIINSIKYSWLTTQKAWEALLWSFACCLLGVWPRVDFEGKPLEGWRADLAGKDLVGGLCFMQFMLLAGLDYMHNYMNPRHFSSSLGPCMTRTGDRTTASWSEMRPIDVWRSLLVTRVNRYLTLDTHIDFCHLAVELSLARVSVDTMQCMDLGTIQSISASTIYMLGCDVSFGGSVDSRIEAAWSV